ncbi:hypothetical protein DYB37_005294 [Aphanomyces astaci]|uniref:PPM-type phosphatase domain-containing protein n=1 Tax=Aphanomyces astaci TaxID=112090 RepID=A0A3R7A1J2_APHAT|nr:hypothetical protein DYB37_005294 [Aphanomyces astaci]
MGCCQSTSSVSTPATTAEASVDSHTPTSSIFGPTPLSPCYDSSDVIPRPRRLSRSPHVPARIQVTMDDPSMTSFYRNLKTTRGEVTTSTSAALSSCEHLLNLPHISSSLKGLKRPAPARSKHRDVMSIFGEKGYILESSHVASDVNTPTSSISSQQPLSPTLPVTSTSSSHIHIPSLSISYGAASIAGRRATNEDRVACYLHEDNACQIGYFAVYDGHGGPNVADFLSTQLHQHVFAHVEAHPSESLDAALSVSMLATDALIYNQAINHGSTAIAMLVDGTTMAFASLGDSQAILSSNDGRDVVDLCRIHRPSDTAERDRIIAAKGSVVDGRIFGVLGVSRAFGDNDLKTSKGAFKDKFNGDIVGGTPDVRLHRMRPDDDFVVLACDGVFDVMAPSELAAFVHTRLNAHGDVQVTCDEVVAHALRLGSTDNLSVKGGGVTRQLVAWPSAATEWIVRVSIADVEHDGPFSLFEGIRRWFGVLEGVGVRLFESIDVVVGDALYEFDGALAPSCSLLDGRRVRDFNIMLREGPGRKLSVVDAKASPALTVDASTQWVGLFTVDGGLLRQQGPSDVTTVELPKMGLSWLDNVHDLSLYALVGAGSGVAYWLVLQLP